jgi:hypothetical protein
MEGLFYWLTVTSRISPRLGLNTSSTPTTEPFRASGIPVPLQDTRSRTSCLTLMEPILDCPPPFGSHPATALTLPLAHSIITTASSSSHPTNMMNSFDSHDKAVIASLEGATGDNVTPKRCYYEVNPLLLSRIQHALRFILLALLEFFIQQNFN